MKYLWAKTKGRIVGFLIMVGFITWLEKIKAIPPEQHGQRLLMILAGGLVGLLLLACLSWRIYRAGSQPQRRDGDRR
jgi:hypothetical protein